MRRISAVLLPSLLILSGCDTLYGVSRTAKLERQPSLECVASVVSTTSGVTTVERKSYQGGVAVTLSGLKEPASIVNNFFYRGKEGSNIVGALQILQDHEGKITFTHSLMDINRKPPQIEVDASRPVMKRIEERLAAECGIGQLTDRVKEKCNGVSCEKLK
jgi:hypothetical protein